MPGLLEISGIEEERRQFFGIFTLGLILVGLMAGLASRRRSKAGSLGDLGVIRPCRNADRTASKRVSSQKWCLWDSKAKKILGRHPTRSRALRQERAIQVRKHG